MVPTDRQMLIILMEAGYIYLQMGRCEDAREVFEGVGVLAPKNEIPFVAIGTAWFSEKKYDQAIRAYNKALRIKSDSPFARAYMGEALFFKGEKKDALHELESAVKLDPQGAAGEFARSLLKAVNEGFTPPA